MKRLLSALFVAAFAGWSCGDDSTPPSNTPAVVTSINPTSGTAAGGTAVTISGSNFLSGATVTIGGVALTGVNIQPNTITGTTGASSTGGPATVSVTNPNTTAGVLSNGFTYIAAPVARISGAPATIIHNTPTTFSGATSTASTGATITQYTWNCGQDASVYGNGCDVSNNATPQFSYRKCGGANRPACTGTNQRTYTVTLTITDSSGAKSTTTFQVTVTNQYN